MHPVALWGIWIGSGAAGRESKCASIEIFIDRMLYQKSMKRFLCIILISFEAAKCQRQNNNDDVMSVLVPFGYFMSLISFYAIIIIISLNVPDLGLGLHPTLSLKLNIRRRINIIGTSEPKGALVIKIYTTCTYYTKRIGCVSWTAHSKWKMRFIRNGYETRNEVCRKAIFIFKNKNTSPFECLRQHSNMIQKTHRVCVWWC